MSWTKILNRAKTYGRELYVGIILHSGELVFCFNKLGITKFLKDWDNECEEYRLMDTQKCRKLP